MIATQNEVADIMNRIFKRCNDLRAAGQKEYALNSNALSNFVKLADELDSTPEKVLWTYAMKHKDGIAAHIRGHESQREDVTGRIADLIVYLCLLQTMIEARRKQNLSPFISNEQNSRTSANPDGPTQDPRTIEQEYSR